MATKRKRKRRTKTAWPLSFPELVLLVVCLGIISVMAVQYVHRVHEATPVVKQVNVHQQFIDDLAPGAKRLHRQTGVLPSITLAQAILESDWGNSALASDYHNLFGVKAGPHEKGQLMSTKEFENDKWVTIKAKFKAYPDWQASLTDHALLLARGTSWNPQQYAGVLKANNYQEAAKALQQDGYATDPTYTAKILELIKRYRLDQYDQQS